MPPDDASHEIGLAVWDLPSPVVIGGRATLKVGVSCSSRCPLAGTSIEIRDESGASIGSARVGSETWPGTIGLYWTEVDVATPATEGDHAWSIQAATQDEAHPHVTSIARVVACRPPEHRVTFEAIEKESGNPLPGVELRVGPFRAATNDDGIAHVDVPAGMYAVCGWKAGYDLVSSTADVVGDMTIHLEVALTPETEQPYWM